jgi:hypothetical protein
VDQNSLESFRKWYEIEHDRREQETEWLGELLEDVDAKLEEWEETLERRSETDSKFMFTRRPGEVPNPSEWETERYYQGLWRWKWDIERRLRDLIRGERDDLEWMARLEGRLRAKERANRGFHPEGPNEDRRPNETRTTPRTRKNRQHKKTSHERQTDAEGN